MAKAKRGGGRRLSLAAFLRRLWKNPQLMERFAESREGRRAVLREFNLTAKHAKLLLDGCVRDIVVELAGGPKLTDNTTVVINCDKGGADVECGHPECESFMKTIAKEQKPKPKKKKR